jgi:hypothetical protein
MPMQRLKVSIWILACLTALIAAVPTARAGFIVANSVTEFSGVQGQDNWFYGYYSSPFTPVNFLQMGTFNPASAPDHWVVDFDPPSPFVWTSLNATGGHPNGITTSGGRDAVEQWAVRRWVSEVDGSITITGNLADRDINAGNGIIGRIFVGNTEVYNATISNGDATGVNYSVTVNVSVGTTIDFAIDPRASNDLTDSTRFTAVIESAGTPAAVPEPSSLVLLGTGALGLLAFLRRRTAPAKVTAA